MASLHSRNILDGALLFRYCSLPRPLQRDLALAVGTDRATSSCRAERRRAVGVALALADSCQGSRGRRARLAPLAARPQVHLSGGVRAAEHAPRVRSVLEVVPPRGDRRAWRGVFVERLAQVHLSVSDRHLSPRMHGRGYRFDWGLEHQSTRVSARSLRALDNLR